MHQFFLINIINFRAKLAEVKRELSLRTRALSCGMPFPEPKVMKEFLNASSEHIDLNDLTTPVPSLIQFVVCKFINTSEVLILRILCHFLNCPLPPLLAKIFLFLTNKAICLLKSSSMV